jgi:hypothetical protein
MHSLFSYSNAKHCVDVLIEKLFSTAKSTKSSETKKSFSVAIAENREKKAAATAIEIIYATCEDGRESELINLLSSATCVSDFAGSRMWIN